MVCAPDSKTRAAQEGLQGEVSGPMHFFKNGILRNTITFNLHPGIGIC